MYAPLVSLMITVPVFGQHEYTHALVADLEREGADYLIVDNRGDYPRIGTERVSTPGENLGWAGGSELGFRLAFAEGYSHAMTLNNDTRVSKGFVAALLDSRLPADAGMVGPMFDVGFPFAVADEKPDAESYVPRARYRKVPAVEGTALVIRGIAGMRSAAWTCPRSGATDGGSTWISRYGLESPGMACTQPRWPTSTISGARPPIRTSVGTGITGVQVRP